MRCLVFVESIDLNADLSVSAVAADVERNLAQAVAQVVVNGYTGDISDPMPSWRSFDVDTYAQCVALMGVLAKQVFRDAAHIRPVLLNESEVYEPKDFKVGRWQIPHQLADIAM